MIIYYAHSKLSYGTDKPVRELKTIREHFSTAEIINPEDYKHFTGNMQAYLDLTKDCDLTVFSEFKGFIGGGVTNEVMHSDKALLLRDGKFISNFQMYLNDKTDLKFKFAKVIICNGGDDVN